MFGLRQRDNNSPVLLLTGTIDSTVYNNVGNKIVDVNERLLQYESCIERYIKESPFTKIVFIENSGDPFDAKKFIAMAENCEIMGGGGKKFEFISGTIKYDEIMKKGKSFGDAYLIYEALEKSSLLNEAEIFYKITGRIFLLNAYEIYKTRNKFRNEFIVYDDMGWCLTNIFKANITDYRNVLADIWKDCDETTVNDIEIAFYKRLKCSEIEIGSFLTYPHFDGKMGATLRNYSGGKAERIVRNIMARFHCFFIRSRMQKVIKIYMKIRGIKGYK